MGVHPGTVVFEDRLRHEGRGQSGPSRDVFHDVLIVEQLVGHLHERRELHVDLGLAGRPDLVVVRLDHDAELLHLENHFGAQVLHRVRRRDREVALLVAGLVGEVRTALFASRVPLPLDRIDVVVALVRSRAEARRIEDEELGLGPDEDRVADAALL